MALLPQDQRSQIMLLLVIFAAAGGYFFWTKVHRPQTTRLAAANTEADSLEAIVEAAKRDLASGSIEDLRRRVEGHRASLEVMRRLVPAAHEIPSLIDDMSTKAKVRGITLDKIDPLMPEPGLPFDTYRYRLGVFGHYDQIGEYLADIASLPRIVVPHELLLEAATPTAQKMLGDTLGALLIAEFSIRTYVKAAGGARSSGGGSAGP